MARELRVGIIGVNVKGGWASEAHIPAIRALPGLTLAAVATSRQETADEAAHAFGAGKAFAGGLALIADPAIDVVTIATRVPDHRDLVLAALTAGKHVYCEWPLGTGPAEANLLAEAARAAGVKHAIGLQLRGSPAVRQARTLLSSGAIGRVLSMNAISTTAGFGPNIPPQFAYLEDPSTFANMVTIQAAHTLDLLMALGDPLAVESTLLSRQFPLVQLGEPPRPHERVTFDHVFMQGRFGSGAPFGLEVAGGRKNATPFHLDIVGGTGSLRLEGGAPRGVQSSRIGLLWNGERQTVDEAGFEDLADGALNVAGIYQALHNDIAEGTATVADFSHAARLTARIEEVLRIAENDCGNV